MKRKLNVICGLIVFLVSLSVSFAHGNTRGESKVTVDGKEVSVEYGRPELKGRPVGDMLAKLKPGGVWRIGADKSTTFTSAADLAFADGTEVPSGAYSIWARKSAEGGWSLVFNKETGQWGTRHDPTQDLVAVHLNESKASDSAELVTIGLAEAGGGAVLTIQWGEMSLSTKFKAN